jgi:hypothetical protein
MELIGIIDKSLQDAMEALGGDLEKYLKEAEATLPEVQKAEEEKRKKEEEEKAKKAPKGDNVLTPFIGIGKGLGELFGWDSKDRKSENEKKEKKKPKRHTDADMAGEVGNAGGGILNVRMYTAYKNFKKAHGMIAWR